jgi:hypothetical protein
MKNIFFGTKLFLVIFIQLFFLNNIHSQVFFLVNDTVHLTPEIPKTMNFLVKDLIPSGDSIRVVGAMGNGYVMCTSQSGNNYTYVANQNGTQWDYGTESILTYRVYDFTLDTNATAKIVFLINDNSYDSIFMNNINAQINSTGYQLTRPHGNGAGFEVPKFSGKNTIFVSTLWIGGLDDKDSLHLAGARYGQGPATGAPRTHSDYFAGPVMDSTAYSIYQDTLWNYVWNLKKSDIDYHIAHWQDQGYKPIHDILTWPGNGNVSLGEADKLAPFYDRNNDGIYNPMDGDYPLIRGDQALFFILNDDRSVHMETYGEKLKVEIHGMAYVFNIPDDSALMNTVFMNYKIINRSANTYHKSYIGVFTDTDIGFPYDDYIGCDVERSYYYGYNGTPVDGSGQPGSYGANPPAQAVAIIGGPYMDPDGIDNPKVDSLGHQLCNASVNGTGFGDGIVDNERYGMTDFVWFDNNGGVPSWAEDPLYSPQYYMMLQGIWNDSVPMTYGGDGHAPSSYGSPCKFMFPGTSDTLCWGTGCVLQTPLNWTEFTANNAPWDRRGLGSSGPFTFNPGQEQELDLAYTFARDYNNNYPDGSLNKLRNYIETIEGYFDSNQLPDGSSFNGIASQPGNSSIKILFYPNPASSQVNILFDRIISTPVSIRVYNANGVLVSSESSTPSGRLITIDISGLSAGLYLFSTEFNGQVITKKISVIR